MRAHKLSLGTVGLLSFTALAFVWSQEAFGGLLGGISGAVCDVVKSATADAAKAAAACSQVIATTSGDKVEIKNNSDFAVTVKLSLHSAEVLKQMQEAAKDMEKISKIMASATCNSTSVVVTARSVKSYAKNQVCGVK